MKTKTNTKTKVTIIDNSPLQSMELKEIFHIAYKEELCAEEYIKFVPLWRKLYKVISLVNRRNNLIDRMQPSCRKEKREHLSKEIDYISKKLKTLTTKDLSNILLSNSVYSSGIRELLKPNYTISYLSPYKVIATDLLQRRALHKEYYKSISI